MSNNPLALGEHQNAMAQNLGYWAYRAAEKFADHPAIIDWPDGTERTLTHGELELRLQRSAALLSVWGFEPGTRLAVGIGNRAEFIEVFFGAMRAGLVPVPLNLRQGRAHLTHVIRDAGCLAAVIEPGTNAHLPQIIDECRILRRVAVGHRLHGWENYEELMAAASGSFAPRMLLPEHPALLAYTSGSTGQPKGVVLTHAGQVWWVNAYQKLYSIEPDERSLVAVPLYHKNAMAGVVKSRLPAGASMILMPSFRPRAFLESLSRYRCTHTTGVPTIYSLALQERDLLQSLDLSALRSVVVGSAPVHDELHKAMEQAFRCHVYQTYGLTEGGPVVIGPPSDGRAIPLGSCGQLWPGCSAKLMDADGREQSSRGELWLRNPGVTPGYHGLAQVNAQRIKDGWLATGDLFRVDAAGFWFFMGRADDMFVCGGENIFPKEIEELLLTHPAVREACVVPAWHATKEHAPVALVALKPGVETSEAQLKQFCLDQGAAFAHPRRIFLADALPLNGAGKVDRAAVRERLQASLKEACAS